MSQAGDALVSWGRVLRLSLLPTALADGFAGFALVGLDGFPPFPACALFVSSVGIYHGALALNDWADCQTDAELRPERPIPSGQLRRGAVLAVGLALILLGIACALAIDIRLGLWMAALSTLAIGYDIWLRGPLLGPLTIGSCRAMHLAAPVVLLAFDRLQELWPIFVGYGAFVFTLSTLARLEERPSETLGHWPRSLLLAQAAIFMSSLLLGARLACGSVPFLVLLLAAFGGVVLMRLALSPGEWTPARVQRATGTALRLLLVYSAAVALSGPGSFAPVAAACILAGYPIAHRLRKVFPPT